MKRNLILWLLLVGLGAFAAGDDLPDWALPAAAVDCSAVDITRHDAVCLLDHETVTLRPDGRLEMSDRLAYRILTAGGTSRALRTLFLGPDSDVKDVRAYIQYPDGSVRRIKEKDCVTTELVTEALYSDRKQLLILLPNAVKGCLVCFEYTQIERPDTPFLTWWVQQGIPVRDVSLTIRNEAGDKPVWKAYNLPDVQPVEQTGALSFRFHNLEALPDEPAAPPDASLRGRIVFRFPWTGTPAAVPSGNPTWQDIAAWYTGLTRHCYDITPDIQTLADSLWDPAADQTTNIRTVSDWVRDHIRYVAITIGQSGLVPHHPGEVLSVKYGDCKDMSFLLSALLRARGVDAWPMLCGTAGAVPVDPDFPNPAGFNHCITAITSPDHGRRAFDPTDKMAVYPAIGSAMAGRQGLVVKPDGGSLADICCARPAEVTIEVQAGLSANGLVTAQTREIFSPEAASGLREYYQGLNEKERAEAWQNRLTDRVPDPELQDFAMENLYDPAADLVISYTLRSRHMVQSMDGICLLKPFFVNPVRLPRLDEPERKLPLDFRYDSVALTHQIRLIVPETYALEEAIPDQEHTTPFGTLSVQGSFSPGLLTLTRRYTLNPETFDITHYEAARAFLKRLTGVDNTPLLFVTE